MIKGHWGRIGKMEENMEATIRGLYSFFFDGEGFRV